MPSPILIGIILAITAIVIGVQVLFRRKTSKSKKDKKAGSDSSSPILIGPAQIDVEYFDRYLSDKSSHLDVLFYVATCPDLVNVTTHELKKIAEIKEKRIAAKEKEALGETEDNDNDKKDDLDVLDDSGWADDDDDEEDEQAKEAALKAKKADQEREFQRKQLAKATGKLDDEADNMIAKLKLEGIDEGVLGQKWVETILEKEGVWPPNIPGLKTQRNYFEDDEGNKVADPLDVPAVRRNVCILMGRLYSQTLNSHPDLLKAGPEGSLDPTYFQYCARFRQRNGLLLESTLRLALSSRSYHLAKTIIESICMFKIGVASATDTSVVNWFNSVILKQYGGMEGLPRLKVSESVIETPDKEVMETGDEGVISLTIARTHAEKFFQNKLEFCKKQNMNPQLVLGSYQEGWWILVRAQNLDSDGEPALISAWPFMVRNIQQKNGKIKCKFQVPDTPGKYKFLFDIKSQEFLGADQSFEILADVVEGDDDDDDDDDEEDEEDDDDNEVKKDK